MELLRYHNRPSLKVNAIPGQSDGFRFPQPSKQNHLQEDFVFVPDGHPQEVPYLIVCEGLISFLTTFGRVTIEAGLFLR